MRTKYVGGLVGETLVKSSLVKDLVVVQTQVWPTIVWWTLKWKINSRIVWPSMLRLTMWWCGSAHVSLVELMWQLYNSHVVVCGLDNDGQRGKAAVDFRVGESVVTCWLPLHYLQILQHRNRGRERGFSSVLP